MPSPITISSSPSPAPSPSTNSPSGQEKKRKRPSLPTGSSNLSSSQSRQTTISQMFAAQGGSDVKKRLRTTPPLVSDNTNSNSKPIEIKDEDEDMPDVMSSSRTNVGGVIDLTESSPAQSRDGTPRIDKGKGKEGEKPEMPRTLALGNKPRKMVVRFLKDKPKNDATSGQAYFDKTWAELDSALDGIFNDRPLKTPLEVLYRGAENLCTAGKAPLLYEKVAKRIEDFASGQLRKSIGKDKAARGVVAAISDAWKNWKDQLRSILSIFFYMERTYLYHARDPKIRRIVPTGFAAFRKHILSDERFSSNFLDGVVRLFLDARKKYQAINPDVDELLKTCVEMLQDLELYSEEFERRFFESSADYYRTLAETEVAKGDIVGYLVLVNDMVEKEAALCLRFRLEAETRKQLMFELEREMISKQTHFLTSESNFKTLAGRNDQRSLSILYDLLARTCRPEKYLKNPLEQYVTEAGKSIILDTSRDSQMIIRLLIFKCQLDELHETAFHKNEQLGYALRDSFKAFINVRRPGDKTASKVPEQLAKHLDHLLRVGIRGLPKIYEGFDDSLPKPARFKNLSGNPDAELEMQFDLSLEIFRFIASKDIFEAFYKNHLARRLLLSKTASMDAERVMMSKLKTECGINFTHNMEGMFKDIERSKEITASFRGSKMAPRDLDMTFDVLSAAAWPTYADIPMVLPKELQKPLAAFEKFYVDAHKGRQLSWRHYNSHAHLMAHFEKGSKELVVSALQASVLLLFNDVEGDAPLSYQTIKSATGLPDDDLKRTLQSLFAGNHRVLRKNSKGAGVSASDTFCVNVNFSDERKRIKINQIQAKETKAEKEDTIEKVERDRQYETQAAICRVLKARKILTEMELLEAVIEQTKGRGLLEFSDIKSNIEKLCEKEYIRKEADNRISYVV